MRGSQLNRLMAATGAGLALLIGGCGGSSSTTAPTPGATLDTHRVALDIQAAILKQRHLSADVLCPLGIKQQAGVVFVCTVTTNPRTKRAVTNHAIVTQHNNLGYVTYVIR